MNRIDIDRRTLLGGAALLAGAATLNVLPNPARAAAPKAGAQVAGVQRFKLGDIEVTAISDGYADLPVSVFPTADKAGIAALQRQAFQPVGDTIRLAVNHYAINNGDRLVLIDGGTGNLLGPTVGRAAANLKAAGIDPATVDAILATHLHPDHIGGIFSAEGAALFPKAELVAHEADVAFWTNQEFMDKAPDPVKNFFRAAQGALKAYEGRVRRFSRDGEVAKSIASMHLPGHTPGHCGFVVSSGNASLLIWGDLVHSATLQFAKPEWGLAFDVDQNVAIATRKKAFDMIANDRLQIAGMHLPFPGVGHVAKAGDGYAFVKTDWQYL